MSAPIKAVAPAYRIYQGQKKQQQKNQGGKNVQTINEILLISDISDKTCGREGYAQK